MRKQTVNERLMDALQEFRENIVAVAQNELTTRARVHRLEKYVDVIRDLTGLTSEQMDARFAEMFPAPPPEPVPTFGLQGVTLPQSEQANVVPFTAPGESVPVETEDVH